MKKTKLLWIGAVSAIVIVAVVLMLLQFGSHNSGQNELTLEQARQQLDAALSVADSASGADAPAFLSEIDRLNGYDILELKKTEDTYLVTVRVYAPDVYTVAKTMDSENTEIPQEELAKEILIAITDSGLVEKQIQLVYEWREDQYIPILTEDFVDAYYGGVLRLYKESIEQVMGETEVE